MVSMIIMFVLASTTTFLFSNFTSSFLSSRQRDSIQSIILKDLGDIRELVKEYCRLPNSGELEACTGAIPTQDQSGAYNPDDAPNGICDQNRLAAAMVAANPNKFPASSSLDKSKTSVDLRGIEITRSLTASGNELSVSYTTTTNNRVTGRNTTILVPPALGWCP